MSEKRIVMEVRVQWVTDDDDDVVRNMMEMLDEKSGVTPLDFVEQSILMGSPEINFRELGLKEGYFEIRVEGPPKWAAAYSSDGESEDD